MASYNQVAAKLDGIFYRGDDFWIPLQILIGGNVTDTTSYNFDGYMVTSTGRLVSTVTRLADTTGNIAVAFTDTQTASIPPSDGTVSLYITMTDAAAYTRTIISGEYEVLSRA
jgi:hypothetical protein